MVLLPFSTMRVFLRERGLPGQRAGTALPCSAVSLTAITACRNCANSNCYLASKSDGYALSAASAAGLPPIRPSGPTVIIRFLSGGFNPRNTLRLVSRSCSIQAGRMHEARNELPWSVNYALSLPIGNNGSRGLLIAERIIRKRRCQNSSVIVDTILILALN